MAALKTLSKCNSRAYLRSPHRTLIVPQIITVLLLVTYLLIINAHADPPGSPPYGAYIADSTGKAVRSFYGEIKEETITFKFTLNAGEYGTLEYVNTVRVNASTEIKVIVATAIAAAVEYSTENVLDVGTDRYDHAGDMVERNECMHYVASRYKKNNFSITKNDEFTVIDYELALEGEFVKEGLFCFDKRIEYEADGSSYLDIIK